MKKEDLQKMTNEDLLKKEKGTKIMIGIFIPLILLLSFFAGQEYFSGGENGILNLTMAICTVGGLVSILPELKLIRVEKKHRGL